jgi:hypothetical protein
MTILKIKKVHLKPPGCGAVHGKQTADNRLKIER